MLKSGERLKYTRYSAEYIHRFNPTCDVLKANRMKCGRPAIASVLEITDKLEENNTSIQGHNICNSHLAIAKVFAENFEIVVSEVDENDNTVISNASYY